MNFEKKNVESQKVAFIKNIGTLEEIDRVIGKLIKWVQKNNVQLSDAPFAIYYTEPCMVNPDEMVYDILIPVSEDVEGDDEVKIKTLPSCTIISTIHKGSYTTLAETYKGIWDYIIENKYNGNGYPREVYLNSPQDVPDDELLTEIQFPIKE